MIFEYTDYVKYIQWYIQKLPQRGRGFKALMARHLSCKTSFISQVLGRTHDLSVEQALQLNSLFRHSETEGSYFLALVQFARAGTKEARAYFKKQFEELRNEALRLKHQVKAERIQNKEDEFKYFSSPYFAYAHLLTTIPQFQTREALLAKLQIESRHLDQILDFLLELGFIKYHKGRYLPGPSTLHLPDDSSVISAHHTGWRIQAIKSCQRPSAHDLHYSSVISISPEDFMKLKSLLVQHLDQYRKIINASECVEPYSLCFDFFAVK
ncbi:MAG: TIGR02147 family protein [Bdellovibrionales bacterium]|nr:TIGR02147 family protein [Bdellovibrionales bacterium]